MPWRLVLLSVQPCHRPPHSRDTRGRPQTHAQHAGLCPGEASIRCPKDRKRSEGMVRGER